MCCLAVVMHDGGIYDDCAAQSEGGGCVALRWWCMEMDWMATFRLMLRRLFFFTSILCEDANLLYAVLLSWECCGLDLLAASAL